MARKKKKDPIVVPISVAVDVTLDEEMIREVLDDQLHEMLYNEMADSIHKIIPKSKVNAIIKEIAGSMDVEAEVRKVAKERLIEAALGR